MISEILKSIVMTKTNPDCLFCRREVMDDPLLLIAQNPWYWVRLNPFPANPGHALLIPKAHERGVFAQNPADWLGFTIALKQLEGWYARQTAATLVDLYQAIAQREELGAVSAALASESVRLLADFPWPADSFTVGWNSGPGKASGWTIAHLHGHVVPRWPDDVQDNATGILAIFDDQPESVVPRGRYSKLKIPAAK